MTVKPRLIAFLSHPIQHYVPWFAGLGEGLDGRFRVVFASRHGLDAARDPEFGQVFSWDMDLLAGYAHEFYPASAGASPAAGFCGIRFPHVEEYLRREKPEAVMIFGWLFAGYWEVARAAAKLGIPYFIRAESNLLNRGPAWKWWIKQQSVGRLCRGAACCLAVGKRNAELYRAYGVPPERIRVAPYFVDNEFFAREAERHRADRSGLRQRFGLPKDAVVLLFMGKLIAKKHPGHLLDAWLALPEKLRRRSAVLFAGSGELLEPLRARASAEPRVAFSGFLNRGRLAEAYGASDVLVLPSDQGETWGLVVNEAMASGLPAIVSDRVGSAPDLVLDGVSGYTYPFGDIQSLGSSMAALIREPERMRVMGSQAREQVRVASIQLAVDEVVAAIRSAPHPQ